MLRIIKLRYVVGDDGGGKWYDGDILVEEYDDEDDDFYYVIKNGFYMYDDNRLRLYINDRELFRFDIINHNLVISCNNRDYGYNINGYKF